MKIGKVEKPVPNLHNETKLFLIRKLMQALNHEQVLKKVYRVIKFIKKAWLKPYIDMNTDLRKAAKIDFEKDFFKLMRNSVFGKNL